MKTFVQGEILTAQDLNGNFSILNTLAGAQEPVNVVASGATGTIHFNLNDNIFIAYYTGNATTNFTVNFRGDASTTLNNVMNIGSSLTFVLLVTNGASAFYPTAYAVDSVTITPKWVYGAAPTGGNASGIDSYTFTLVKTASATYTLLASQNKYA